MFIRYRGQYFVSYRAYQRFAWVVSNYEVFSSIVIDISMVIILIVGNASANNVTVTESTIDTESEELTTEQLV